MADIKEVTTEELAEIFRQESHWSGHLDDRIRDTTIEMIVSGDGLTWIAVAEEEGDYPWYHPYRWFGLKRKETLGFTATYREGDDHWGLTVVKSHARGTGLGKALVEFRRDNCPHAFKVKIGATNWKSIKSCLRAGMALIDALPVDNPEKEYPDPDPVVLVMEHKNES